VEGSATALYLLGGKWVIGALQLGLLAYMVHLWTSKTIKIDTTDAFRQLPQQKKQRCALLIAHLILFGTVLCRWVGALADCMHSDARRSKHMHAAGSTPVCPWYQYAAGSGE
jgi:hypothetical protein